jgi:hypothetical protein
VLKILVGDWWGVRRTSDGAIMFLAKTKNIVKHKTQDEEEKIKGLSKLITVFPLSNLE